MKARILLLAALSLPVFAHAGACDGADHRAFDFSIGDWDVTNATNDKHTHNLITREYDGCVIHEHYTGPKGYTGESLNAQYCEKGCYIDGALKEINYILRDFRANEIKPIHP